MLLICVPVTHVEDVPGELPEAEQIFICTTVATSSAGRDTLMAVANAFPRTLTFDPSSSIMPLLPIYGPESLFSKRGGELCSEN